MTACPICGSPPREGERISGPDRFHGAPGSFSVAACSSCGAGWTLPPANADELASYYPPSYGYLSAGGRLQRLRMNHALAAAPVAAVARLEPGAVLDVGCGRGDLAAALIRRGWRASGVEPSPEAAAVARAQGVDAHTGTLADAPFEEASFDAAVMRHSLEHVPYPLADLARVFRLLRPGGLLAVSVPNFDSWERRRFGSAWFHLDLPRHRTHFTPRALRVALAKSGFDALSVQTAGDAGSLLATLQYKVAGRLLSRSVSAAMVQYGAGLALTPVRRALDRQEGGGPFLHAVARRP
jgi:SAM-dependent methyltransferase